MPALPDLLRRWEVRPTLHLPTRLTDRAEIDGTIARLEGVAGALRKHPNVTAAHVSLEFGENSVGITATIALAQLSTPGAAVDEATNLLAEACAAAGLVADAVKEVVADMADDDPRSL